MRRANSSLLAAVLLVASGCGLPTSDPEAVIDNSCSSDDVCGPNGACVDGTCVSLNADLPGLYITIDLPPQDGYSGASSTLLLLEDQGVAFLPGAGSGVRNLDLVTAEVVEVAGQMDTDPSGYECADIDGGMPVSMELYPVGRPAGIPQVSYSVGHASESSGKAIGGPVTINVPKGTYDVYIRPAVDDTPMDMVQQGCSAPPPPALIKGQPIDGSVSVTVGGVDPLVIDGLITTGGLVDLEGWRMDIIDNVSGRVISTSQTLTQPAMGNDFSYALSYWSSSIYETNAFIRLTPPEDKQLDGMPSVLWDFDAVTLLGQSGVGLDVSPLSDSNARPISVSGSVLDGDSNDKVAATVVIQSKSLLPGNASQTMFYRRTLETDGDGNITDLKVLPGTYQVTAVPTSHPELALTTTEWIFSSTQPTAEGKAILLGPKANLTATVTTPQGEPASAMPALAQASAAQTLSYGASVLSTSVLEPTTATGITGPNGGFAVNLDPGIFDVFVRPGDGSALPWLVEPRVNIPSPETIPTADLGQLTITHPVVLSGGVLSPMGVRLAGATIRAWLSLPSIEDEEAPPTAVQIGETTADGSGNYRLLLPASISQ